MKMNKTDLIQGISERAELSKKDAEKALNAMVDLVIETVAQGGKVQLIGFGSFEARERAAREGRNPQTGDSITIPAKIAPVFKAGKVFKDAVSK